MILCVLEGDIWRVEIYLVSSCDIYLAYKIAYITL